MRFCRKCGRSLISEPERCERCGTPTSIKYKTPPIKHVTVKECLKVDIKPSILSTEEDVITNPQDYPHQSFPYVHHCIYGHNWPPGTKIPIAKGYHYCPECGEKLKIDRSGRKGFKTKKKS